VTAPASLARFRETVALLRTLLAGGRSDFRGRHVASSGFRVRTGGSGSSIGIAGFGPRMVDLAGEIADRLILAHVTPEATARAREAVDRSAHTHGRERVELAVWMSVGPEGPATFEQVARALAVYVGQRGYGEMFADAGFGEQVRHARSGVGIKEIAASLPSELVHAVAGLGGAGAALERARAHGAAGADVVCLVPATADDPGAAQLLAAVAAEAGLGGGG
jgi:alkanesulfonate monooxygenase SsuD/methylene tetrahydromethanopterin reductase-like flavin-dependent oxidoreductase (luciferase family)